MGGLLVKVTERLEREAYFAKATAQLQRLRQDNPDEWDVDRAESRSWQAGTDQDTLSGQDEPGWWE